MVSLTFQLSTNCNLRCTYCYQKNKCTPVMSFEVAKKLLDDFFLYKTSRDGKIFKILTTDQSYIEEPPSLEFFGGECTLYADLMEQICDYFEEKCKELNLEDWLLNYRITTESNGTTTDIPAVRHFYERFKSHLDSSITIDGCKACHDRCRLDVNGKGTYDRTIKGINLIKKLTGKPPITKQTFCKENMFYLKESIKNLIDLGYTEIPGNFDNLNTNQWLTPEESEQYYNYLKEAIDYVIENKINVKWIPIYNIELIVNLGIENLAVPTCGSTGKGITVKWDGKLYLCSQLNESFTQSKDFEMCLGDVDEGITNLDVLNKIRHNNSHIFDYECFSCPFKSICEPCPAKSLLLTGQYNRHKFNCGAGLAQVKAMFYFVKRAKETDYPYFRELIEKFEQKLPDGLPNRPYLLYKKK